MTAFVPFWRDDYPRPVDLTVGELADRCDVAVVGAGYTGLHAARVLARSGAAVTVVDAGPVGAGASSLNGGQVNYGLKAATSEVFRNFGEELGHRFWEASLRSIDLVEEVVKAEAIDCSFVRSGAAELGHMARDLKAFTEEAEWMAAKVGFELKVVGPERLAEVIASPAFHCAMVDTVGAGLHPARYVYGLAEAAARTGVTLVEHAPVEGIERHGDGYRLATGRGELAAAEVLVATNGYTGDLVPGLRRGLLPVGSYIVATEPLRPDLAERLMPGNRVMWTARRFLNYFRRTPDNRILMGGRNNLRTGLDLGESATVLGATVGRLFPELKGLELTHSWGGTLAVTFDLMPHIGRIDGIWYALGYGGHGVGIATYVGTEVGRLMAGEIDSSPFAEIPHPTRWFYRNRPWFLPLAARWYRLLDWLGR